MGEPRIVDLDAPGLDWTDVTMPAASAPVRLVRLHADAATGSSVSLVRFPAGWTRPGTGHYTCAEEFTVLDGRISVSGTARSAGAYAYLPELTTRTDSFVGAGGCLAVAWFSGPPRWKDGVAEEAPGPGAETGRTHSALLGSLAELSGRLPGIGDGATGLDATFLDARVWAYAPDAASLPDLPGRVLVRRWPASGD
ncbi:hypothetical protein SAMN04489712_101835 [Thermomonospora echinospora]|uniref:ChrR-like cupin domain-containing protein n=1 Tax=Thermomonospora echinospora TaxID=1992 RepID=A0A1H5U1T5_9ACTN|nr:hypothetical protein [Thermomonospora echinospora]SEF68970.1 hypothetical protein SAMN04489712_101835 [Thermomonospora echinospora]